MKRLILTSYRLSLVFIIIILAISCKKDNNLDEQNEIVYTVNFTFANFKASISFLKNASTKANRYANASNPANYSEGKLYFWSFNNEK